MARPRSFVAHIRWSAKDRWYFGFVPGVDGTETTASSKEELLAELARKAAARLRDRAAARARAIPAPRGFRRVDVTV